MIVCICNCLSETQVRAAIRAGARTADAVYSRCGVRRNCGRCQETIDDMLKESRKVLEAAE